MVGGLKLVSRRAKDLEQLASQPLSCRPSGLLLLLAQPGAGTQAASLSAQLAVWRFSFFRCFSRYTTRWLLGSAASSRARGAASGADSCVLLSPAKAGVAARVLFDYNLYSALCFLFLFSRRCLEGDPKHEKKRTFFTSCPAAHPRAAWTLSARTSRCTANCHTESIHKGGRSWSPCPGLPGSTEETTLTLKKTTGTALHGCSAWLHSRVGRGLAA